METVRYGSTPGAHARRKVRQWDSRAVPVSLTKKTKRSVLEEDAVLCVRGFVGMKFVRDANPYAIIARARNAIRQISTVEPFC